ncbi:unnamed protein product [Pleuronectes platessa]|uniref:Uncharacterized protein n=1 Tax=Pleuronectes platessa TaxID=8262 RepID=A0A9N7Z8L5_PLEPL|nr:unnamed protein product [Pleuronectes platessa]
MARLESQQKGVGLPLSSRWHELGLLPCQSSRMWDGSSLRDQNRAREHDRKSLTTRPLKNAGGRRTQKQGMTNRSAHESVLAHHDITPSLGSRRRLSSPGQRLNTVTTQIFAYLPVGVPSVPVAPSAALSQPSTIWLIVGFALTASLSHKCDCLSAGNLANTLLSSLTGCLPLATLHSNMQTRAGGREYTEMLFHTMNLKPQPPPFDQELSINTGRIYISGGKLLSSLCCAKAFPCQRGI